MENFKEDVLGGRALLVDVRTDEEWAEGHAEGAMHFDLMRIMHGEAIPGGEGKSIYLYCHSGNRAGMAEMLLRKKGVADAKNLGGLEDVSALGFRMVN